MWWWKASSARLDRGGLLADEAGDLLIERLVALALSSLIVVATLSLWQKKQEAFFRGTEAAQAQQDARAALAIMVKDLRQARTIVTAEADRVTFTSILDAAPAPERTFDLLAGGPCALRCVRYDRGQGAGPQPVADDVVAGGLQFVYRDTDGNPLPAPVSAANRALIQQVDVTVRGQMNLPNPDPPFTLSSTVKLRNR